VVRSPAFPFLAAVGQGDEFLGHHPAHEDLGQVGREPEPADLLLRRGRGHFDRSRGEGTAIAPGPGGLEEAAQGAARRTVPEVRGVLRRGGQGAPSQPLEDGGGRVSRAGWFGVDRGRCWLEHLPAHVRLTASPAGRQPVPDSRVDGQQPQRLPPALRRPQRRVEQ